jgi:hypothetical protein
MSAIGETVDAVLRKAMGRGEYAKAMQSLIRAWAPAGVQINRAWRAMEQGKTAEEKVRIFFNAVEQDQPGAVPLELHKLVPDIEVPRP